MFFSEASAPTTSAPMRAIGSDSSPPPQPISRMRRPSAAAAPSVAAEIVGDAVADIGEADRIELVQRPELALRIPPFGGHGGKPVDFGLVDGAAGCSLMVGTP